MPTAFVTGATAGMGAAFARLLSSEGYHLVLLARDGDRLNEMAAELGNAEVLPADLSTTEGCRLAEDRLSDPERPIDLLINNAGIGLPHGFLRNTVDEEDRLIAINVRSVMRLTHAVLPGMVKRGRGGVVNVSSVAGFGPVSPGHTYGASKSWVTSFSESLFQVMRPKGVRVMALCPGFVHTEFHARAGIDMSQVRSGLWMDAPYVVRAAMADLRKGKAISTPSVQYKVLGGVVRHTPRPLFRALIGGFAKRAGRNPD